MNEQLEDLNEVLDCIVQAYNGLTDMQECETLANEFELKYGDSAALSLANNLECRFAADDEEHL